MCLNTRRSFSRSTSNRPFSRRNRNLTRRTGITPWIYNDYDSIHFIHWHHHNTLSLICQIVINMHGNMLYIKGNVHSIRQRLFIHLCWKLLLYKNIIIHWVRMCNNSTHQWSLTSLPVYLWTGKQDEGTVPFCWRPQCSRCSGSS